jgi:putative ABC transport system substrate-binding protein
MKRIFALLLTLAFLAFALLGCGKADDGKFQIGVVQTVEHTALDAAREGFIAALAENGYVDGENISLDIQNAQGDASNLSTIGDRFVSQKKDLVLAITTDAAQAMAGKTTTIPILATAVTSYTVANLVESDEHPGGNVSGTSDMNPVAAQIDLVQALVPEVKTIGLIYNASEDNSVLQINIAKERINELGLQTQEVTVTSVNDVQQAMQSLVGKCEAVYIPTDNVIASAIATVHSVAGPAKLPVICGESNMTLQGGLATMGINYYDLGYKTGLMALKVIDGAEVADMPIEYADQSDEITINGQVAEEIGFTIPAEYQDAVVYPEA